MDSRILYLDEDVLKLAAHLKWRVIAFTVSRTGDLQELKEFKEKGRKMGLDVTSRLDIVTSSIGELKGKLLSMRRNFELIGVYPLNIEVARTAARDNKVDFLVLPSDLKLKVFDEGVASLMENSKVLLEVDLVPLIEQECSSRLLRLYRRAYDVAKKHRVKVVFASGAKAPLELRAPRDLAALASLITLDEEKALNGLSTIPLTRLTLNRSKLRSGFILPGVSIAEED